MKRNNVIFKIINCGKYLFLIVLMLSCLKLSDINNELIAIQDSQTKDYFFSDSNMKKVNNKTFEYAENFIGDYAIIKQNNTSYVIDKKFEKIYKAFTGPIELYKDFIIIRKYYFKDECYNLKKKKHIFLLSNVESIWKDRYLILKNNSQKFSIFSIDKNQIIYENLDTVRSQYLNDGFKDLDYLYSRFNNKEFLIDINGNKILNSEFDYIFSEIDGIRPFIKDAKLGLFDKQFNVILEPKYDKIGRVSVELSKVRKLNINHLNKLFQNILTLDTSDSQSETFTYLLKNNENFIFNKIRHDIKKVPYSIISDFCENKAIVKNQKGYNFIDTNGKILLKESYKEVKNFRNFLVFVNKNNKWGVIDTKGKLKFGFKYDTINSVQDLYSFYEGKSIVVENNNWGVIDTNGRIVIPFEFSRIEYSPRFKIYVANQFGNLTIFKMNGQKLINQAIPLKINNLEFENSVVILKDFIFIYIDKSWHIYNKKLELVLDASFDSFEFVLSNLIKISYQNRIVYYKLKI